MKNPLKSFWFVLSCIGLGTYVITMIAIVPIIQDTYPSAMPISYITIILFVHLVYFPFFLIFGLKMRKFRKYKRGY